MTKTVTVFDQAYTIRGVNKDGKLVKIGNSNVRMYQGEDVYRNSFRGLVDTEETQLKPTKQAWAPLDHAAAIKPLLDRGYEIDTQRVSRGGLRMVASLTHPDAKKLQDVCGWDGQFWGSKNVGKDGGLQESIMFQNSITPGQSATYTKGFYRVICTNGLYDLALGLPRVRMNAGNFSVDQLASDLFGREVLITEELIKGAKVANHSGAERFSKFIKEYYSNPESVNDLPEFAKKLVSPFDNIPGWVGQNAVQQFEAIARAAIPVHRMDTMNAWTNAINLGTHGNEANRSGARAERKLPALIDSTSDLMGVFSLA